MACLAEPILIGHSFGGLIAEKLLGMDRGVAPIAIDASQVRACYSCCITGGIG